MSEKETDGQSSSICWFTPQMCWRGKTGSRQSPEAEIPSRSPTHHLLPPRAHWREAGLEAEIAGAGTRHFSGGCRCPKHLLNPAGQQPPCSSSRHHSHLKGELVNRRCLLVCLSAYLPFQKRRAVTCLGQENKLNVLERRCFLCNVCVYKEWDSNCILLCCLGFLLYSCTENPRPISRNVQLSQVHIFL